MPRHFCFQPPSRAKQLEAIGLTRGQLPCEALQRCFDPSGGDWEDLAAPQQYEWLATIGEKLPEQSFENFVDSIISMPDKSHSTIYLQPLCAASDLVAEPFPKGPWPPLDDLERAVKEFYRPLQVKVLHPVPMHQLLPRPRSRQGSTGRQYHARQVLDALKSSERRDAWCTLAVTMWDLYPREERNFVHSLSSMSERVGVLSFARQVPDESLASAEREARMLHACMMAVLREIAYLFGLKYCTWFNCLMRGSNGVAIEHQQNHIHLCPVCLRKLHWCIGFDILRHYEGLLQYLERFEPSSAIFEQDCLFLRRRLVALQELPRDATVDRERLAALGLRSFDNSRCDFGGSRSSNLGGNSRPCSPRGSPAAGRSPCSSPCRSGAGGSVPWAGRSPAVGGSPRSSPCRSAAGHSPCSSPCRSPARGLPLREAPRPLLPSGCRADFWGDHFRGTPPRHAVGPPAGPVRVRSMGSLVASPRSRPSSPRPVVPRLLLADWQVWEHTPPVTRRALGLRSPAGSPRAS